MTPSPAMSELTPTRSAVIALKEERRTMREGYAFLDEKCLLLAGAMLQEVRRFDAMRAELAAIERNATTALQAAIARHGVHGLQVYPAADASGISVRPVRRSLLGVALFDAVAEGRLGRPEAPVNPSPEAEACRAAFDRMIRKLVEMAAAFGNLERLYQEYRRTVRRVRALQDVLLPEIEATLYEIETSLEELEQDEALWMRLKR